MGQSLTVTPFSCSSFIRAVKVKFALSNYLTNQ